MSKKTDNGIRIMIPNAIFLLCLAPNAKSVSQRRRQKYHDVRPNPRYGEAVDRLQPLIPQNIKAARQTL